MIEIIKEIGVFIVIVQAVLYLSPGEAYEKYIKVIIGIIMIAKIAQPVLGFFSEDVMDTGFEELLAQSSDFLELTQDGTEEFLSKESETAILAGIEEELKTKLNEKPLEGYQVENVQVSQNQQQKETFVIITVSKTGNQETTRIEIEKVTIGAGEKDASEEMSEEKTLKEYYGQLLLMEPEQIEIRMK